METSGLAMHIKPSRKILTEGVRKKKFDAAMQTEKEAARCASVVNDDVT